MKPLFSSISSATPRASFHGAAPTPNAVETTHFGNSVDETSARKEGLKACKSLFAGEIQIGSTFVNNSMVEESYGSSRFLADEEGVSAQNHFRAEGSYESRRFLLSSSMDSARVKKKRRSRASSRAPIKVFSTDTSNFMAMVHKLTGIPSNPCHSSLFSPWTSKILPFNQGLATLDTSALFLPAVSCDHGVSSSGYSVMHALPPQKQLSTVSLNMNTASQAGHPPVNIDCISPSDSDLARITTGSVNASSLPRLWEASYTGAHQVHGGSFIENEGISRQDTSRVSRQEPFHQYATVEQKLRTSNPHLRLEMLLAGHDKLRSLSTEAISGCIAKEESL